MERGFEEIKPTETTNEIKKKKKNYPGFSRQKCKQKKKKKLLPIMAAANFVVKNFVLINFKLQKKKMRDNEF